MMPLQTAYSAAQNNFVASLLNSKQACSALTPNSAANITFYQRNHRYNRVDALTLAYPTIVALLGDDFFRAMALFFVEITAAHSANLNEDGANFADFIAQFPPTAPYPYLPDCARLDWALHCAHFSLDCSALTAAQFVAIVGDSQQLAKLQLHFHPSMHLLQSSWAIDDIWRMHHGASAPSDWQCAQNILVWRKPQFGEETKQVSDSDAAVIAALMAGQRLGASLGFATTPFDLSAYLKFWLPAKLIVGAQIAE
jgi:hypothetical protein